MAKKLEAPAFEILAGTLAPRPRRLPIVCTDPLDWCANCQRFHYRRTDSERARGLSSARTARERAEVIARTAPWKGCTLSVEVRQVKKAAAVHGPLARNQIREDITVPEDWKGRLFPARRECQVFEEVAILRLGAAEAVIWGE